jgi:holo-[acyl-carrier protein] synthase
MQIINIGADIEEVSRIKRLNKKTLERLFTLGELNCCLPKKKFAEHLAARFAAKEAVFKALPFDGVALKKIEIIKDKTGKPQVLVHDARAKNISFKVSLSHTKKYATAFVIAYKK